MKYETQV